MNTQHTPGPWLATQTYFFGHDSWQITGENGDTNPFLCRVTDSTPDYEANARLIAAAPELLAELSNLLARIEASPTLLPHISADARNAARAAIAKATGNT